jgi:hypothetical protein
MKLEPNELKEELFGCFTDYPEMKFDDINKLVDQPRVQITFYSLTHMSYKTRIFCRKCLMKFVIRKNRGIKLCTF